jgi:hypothetical protein
MDWDGITWENSRASPTNTLYFGGYGMGMPNRMAGNGPRMALQAFYDMGRALVWGVMAWSVMGIIW